MAPGGERARNSLNRLVAPYVNGLADHISRVQDSILDLHARLGWIEQELRELPHREERIMARLDEIVVEAAIDRQMLQSIYEHGDEQRLRLYALRDSEDYELAFTEDEPLVSFIIPTYDRYELLRERSLPSILNQDYKNLEVIVSGDDSPPQTAQVVEEIADPRLRFINRTVRGPYPNDPKKLWLMGGTPPLNDALAVARGRWIAILGDDDEVTPDHTKALVAAAQGRRLEHCYGKMKVRFSDGGELDWESKFPPAYGYFTLQISLYHAGLRFFQFEPIDVYTNEPNDWSLARRMVAAGVRFGRIDALVAFKYERQPMPSVASPDRKGMPGTDQDGHAA